MNKSMCQLVKTQLQRDFLTRHRNSVSFSASHSQQPSTLDYIFVDEDNLIEDIEYNEPLGKSDPVTLQWNLLLQVNEPSGCQDKKITGKVIMTRLLLSFQRSVGMRNYGTNQQKVCG